MNIFILITILILVWIQTDPGAVRSFVARLKRGWRSYLINRYGELAAQAFFESYKERAIKHGAPETLIDEIIRTQWREVAHRLGRKEADKQLGEPTPLERFG